MNVFSTNSGITSLVKKSVLASPIKLSQETQHTNETHQFKEDEDSTNLSLGNTILNDINQFLQQPQVIGTEKSEDESEASTIINEDDEDRDSEDVIVQMDKREDEPKLQYNHEVYSEDDDVKSRDHQITVLKLKVLGNNNFYY